MILALLIPTEIHTASAAASSSIVYVDLQKWNHPTKNVLLKNGIKLNQLKLVGGTYPVYAVTMPKNSTLQNAKGLESFLQDMAKANGYWSLELTDGKMDMKVTADPKARKVTKLAYTGMADYLSGSLALKTLTYSQAGLHPVPYADWSKHAINARIQQVALNPGAYRDSDWKNGLELTNWYASPGIIVSNRFKGEIVDHLRIGSPLSEVNAVLGAPGYSKGQDRFYKTKTFYVGLRGTSKIEEAFVIRKPAQRPGSTLLKELLIALDKGNGVWDAIDSSKALQSFFEIDHGFIHGGGSYASANAGIWVNEFDDDNYVEVYNNYEGLLYAPIGQSNFPVTFTDQDEVISHARVALDNNADQNRRFATEALASPGGTYRLLYDWITSDSQYFTLRSSDHSRRDRIIGGAFYDYFWLTDQYFIASYAYGAELDLFNAAAADPGGGRINILPKIQGLPKLDKDSSDLRIAPINTKSFKLTIEDRSYVVSYSTGANGTLIMSAKLQ
ncbi:hypothetical protein GZH47_11155 [Paenibacillus rhizovicinus]|uniref:Uncharacterized protein n=1 Tax=Paenibacillus rhizovicinus TaxID=2704463 RepID=A0A6C0NYQ2_9BACL|nr:hypothetical protein [Paenibacillus rhizovicinus]QHW31347.1 hypothetical protein GZH47_11155 [Paenibacillus rhizovicinus]